jgi:hypothetical protein
MSYEPEYLAACLYVLNVESYLYRKAHTVFSNWRNAIHVICTESEKNNIFCNIPVFASYII